MTIWANAELGNAVPGSSPPRVSGTSAVPDVAAATPTPKIMHVLTSLEIGGAEMLVFEILAHMPEAAPRTRVVTLRRRGPLAARVEALGIPVDSLDIPGDRGALALAMALARIVRREQPDVIHSHNSSPLIATSLATLFMPDVRLIHTEHGRSSSGSRAARVALRLAGRRTSAIVAVSNDTAAWARDNVGMPGDRIHVIRNGVSTSAAPRPRSPGGHRGVTVARLEPVKGLGTMIRAVAGIAARIPDFHLHIFGDGSERAHLVALTGSLGLKAHITFHGMCDDVPAALAIGDVFLSSSVSEGISLTILEAMAAGLPIVATAVGGTPELVVDRVNGRLVRSGDPDLFAAAAVELLADPVAAAAMGQASRVRAETEFTMNVMVTQYRQLYAAM